MCVHTCEYTHMDTWTHTDINTRTESTYWGRLWLCCALWDLSSFWMFRKSENLSFAFDDKGLGGAECDDYLVIEQSKLLPFFDSPNRDGLISKDEMMAYFLRAKSQLHCKMGPGFIHNFQEMNYLKPTFCEHCAGFVSWSSIFHLCRTLERQGNGLLNMIHFLLWVKNRLCDCSLRRKMKWKQNRSVRDEIKAKNDLWV